MSDTCYSKFWSSNPGCFNKLKSECPLTFNVIFPRKNIQLQLQNAIVKAKKCKSRAEFRKRFRNDFHFMWIKHQEKLNEIFPLPSHRTRTIESARQEALQYSSRHELAKNRGPIHHYLLKNDSEWYEEHFPKRFNIYQNETELINKTIKEYLEILKTRNFVSRSQALINCSKEYAFLRTRSPETLEKLYGKSRTKWTKETAIEEIQDCKTRSEANKKSGAYAWLCLRFPEEIKKKFTQMTIEIALEQIEQMEKNKIKTRSELSQYNRRLFNFLYIKHRDVLEANFPSSQIRWSKESAILVRKKYKTLAEFQKNDRKAERYLAENYPEELECLKRKFSKKISKEQILQELKNYNSIEDFKKSNYKLYRRFRHNKYFVELKKEANYEQSKT